MGRLGGGKMTTIEQQERRERGAVAAVGARERGGDACPAMEKIGMKIWRGPPTFPSSIHFSSIQPNKKLDNGIHILFFNQTTKMVIPN
jgi:hypothetical protein